MYLSKTNDALRLDVLPQNLHFALSPLLPPLCRPHVNLITLYHWNLHRKNRLQFLLVGVLLAVTSLARRPYDLRHAAVSLWLNSGVPATEVARRAGHGVAVLLKIYAHCIDGQADAANQRITDALSTPEADQDPGDEGDADSEPAA